MKCSYDDSLSYFWSHTIGARVLSNGSARSWRNLRKMLNRRTRCPLPLEMSEENGMAFQAFKECHTCNTLVLPEKTKVGDLDHLSGAYRDAGHETCNLGYQDSKMIPVVFHNLV